jgi:tetratricopeptide (TPR) repeat protein
MFLRTWLITLTLTAVFLVSHVPSRSLCGQDTVPETPAGQALAAFLESANNSDPAMRLVFLTEGFAKIDPDSVKQRKIQADQLRSQLGNLTLKRIVSVSDYRISAACEAVNGPEVVLTLSLAETPPHKIESVAIELAGADEPIADLAPLDGDDQSEIIKRLAVELRSKYVFPEVGEEMASAVEKSLADGKYEGLKSAEDFAARLSDQLREICHDKHLRVRAGAPRRPAATPGRRPVDNHGFIKAEILPGGIGYLKFNFFSGDGEALKTAAAAMNFLGNSQALIFDLRENGGGSPEMIAFLSSYLFDEPVHLNSFYNRPSDTTTESWTQKEVPGGKFSPETPVFVLTSHYTFSGAEEFSYNLKNLKRGIIVGETTGGGAHPVMPVALGKRMHITMPFARAINPVTGTNWEGTGVKPDEETSAESALDRAVELATEKIAARVPLDAGNRKATGTGNSEVDGLLQDAAKLMNEQSFEEAASLFAKVTELDPANGLAWLQYGYCLHASGDLDKAIGIHQKAAEFAPFAAMATYNLACACSLKNRVDEAFAYLEKATELGFGDASQLETDPDFNNIRKDPRFGDLIKRLRNGR